MICLLSYSKREEILLKYILQNFILLYGYIIPKSVPNCAADVHWFLSLNPQWTMYIGRIASFNVVGNLWGVCANFVVPNFHLCYSNCFLHLCQVDRTSSEIFMVRLFKVLFEAHRSITLKSTPSVNNTPIAVSKLSSYEIILPSFCCSVASAVKSVLQNTCKDFVNLTNVSPQNWFFWIWAFFNGSLPKFSVGCLIVFSKGDFCEVFH